jgi:hypothetical protein
MRTGQVEHVDTDQLDNRITLYGNFRRSALGDQFAPPRTARTLKVFVLVDVNAWPA